jgi:crotonobetainyl-CoA:carnitine CoA-transferase CaiB-like acyl-CoA transferase
MAADGFGGLHGLRVVEMGVLLAGPFCGQLLADHGAEVIKIEQPGTGTRCASGAGRSLTGSRCGGPSSRATRSRSRWTCAAMTARSWPAS